MKRIVSLPMTTAKPIGRRIEAVLIDLSGTIHVDDAPIAKAIEAIER
jgi:ribonucleotide monophosphatase NagD (HAD superfamily)